MKDQTLIEITVVTDDDTGLYSIGEMDYGMPLTTVEWLNKRNNRQKLADYLRKLSGKCEQGQAPFHDR